MAQLKQERAVRTRETIVRAAAEVFDELGYSGASMREIMKRAGVTLGAVYFHFPNKEALAHTVMNAQPQSVALSEQRSEGLQRLVDTTLLWSRQLQVDPFLRAGVRLSVEQTAFGFQDATPFVTWVAIAEEFLDQARERGELRPGVDSRRTAEFLLGACSGMQMYSELVNERGDLPQRVIDMWELVLPAIAAEDVRGDIEVSLERLEQLSG